MKIKVTRPCMIDGGAALPGETFDLTPLEAHAAVASGRCELVDDKKDREAMNAAQDKANAEMLARGERASRTARMTAPPAPYSVWDGRAAPH